MKSLWYSLLLGLYILLAGGCSAKPSVEPLEWVRPPQRVCTFPEGRSSWTSASVVGDADRLYVVVPWCLFDAEIAKVLDMAGLVFQRDASGWRELARVSLEGVGSRPILFVGKDKSGPRLFWEGSHGLDSMSFDGAAFGPAQPCYRALPRRFFSLFGSEKMPLYSSVARDSLRMFDTPEGMDLFWLEDEEVFLPLIFPDAWPRKLCLLYARLTGEGLSSPKILAKFGVAQCENMSIVKGEPGEYLLAIELGPYNSLNTPESMRLLRYRYAPAQDRLRRLGSERYRADFSKFLSSVKLADSLLILRYQRPWYAPWSLWGDDHLILEAYGRWWSYSKDLGVIPERIPALDHEPDKVIYAEGIGQSALFLCETWDGYLSIRVPAKGPIALGYLPCNPAPRESHAFRLDDGNVLIISVDNQGISEGILKLPKL